MGPRTWQQAKDRVQVEAYSWPHIRNLVRKGYKQIASGLEQWANEASLNGKVVGKLRTSPHRRMWCICIYVTVRFCI